MVALFFGEEFIGSILGFPVWWYTHGFFGVVRFGTTTLSYRWQSYALGVWLHNLFTPMYGMHDWSARLISFFMRVVVIAARGIMLCVEGLVYILLGLFWLAALPVAVIGLLMNLVTRLV